jgi:glycosyltransferase involved in cell wall biosynthesis
MRILFIHNHLSSFVRHDLEALRHQHEVTELCLSSRRVNLSGLWRQVKQHDLVFGWFASWHTFLPLLTARLQGKRSMLVIGGYDLANLPDIGYGHQCGGPKKWISRATIRLAGTLITNSNYSADEARDNAGLRNRRPHVVYHGVPSSSSCEPCVRERLAITIGNVDRPNLWRKGLEPFVRAAAHLPDVRFVVIGAWKDDAIQHLRSVAGSNVEFTGLVDDTTLQSYCRRASVYVQASRHEGFGMSVAEAMLAGCIPVATRTGALPEVIGECGFYSESPAPRDIARAVEAALNAPETMRDDARQRIQIRFAPMRRQAALNELVSQHDGDLRISHATSAVGE